MNTASEPHALIHVATRSPVQSVPIDRQAFEHRSESALNIKGTVSILYESRTLIACIVAIVTVLAAIYAVAVKPVFEANMMIYVEEDSPNASKNILIEASSLFETKKEPVAEIELLRSRSVISKAVDNLKLYIDASPKRFPLIGSWIANKNKHTLSQPGVLGYGGYTWGAEKLEMSLFEVPEALLGHEFTLEVLANQRFRLHDGHSIKIDGTVGSTHVIETSQGSIHIKVDRIAAKQGAYFLLRRMSRLSTVTAIQDSLTITEQGKQSGVIEVKLEGESANEVYRTLSEIGNEYMRQSLGRKAEAAQKSLAFLDQQLPMLKHQLEQAEDRYAKFRNARGTVDLQEEARAVLAQIAAARTRRIDLIQKKSELLARFTQDHPIVAAIDQQRKEIDGELAALNAHVKVLPTLEQDQAKLTRDIKVASDQYTTLSNTAQQLRLTSVGQLGNVRVVDIPAIPEKPVKPNRTRIIALAAMTGLFFASLVAYARKAMVGGVENPHEIESLLHTRILYEVIPHSKNQEKLARDINVSGMKAPILAKSYPEDPAVECLRSFRTALQFSIAHYKSNIVMFAAPTSGAGKSFVIVNFAAVMAASGTRVLLVDIDSRNGNLHNHFGVRPIPGVSRLISGRATNEETIHRNVLENLDFIASGDWPSVPSDYLLQPGFGNMLRQCSGRYDIVLLNTPPVLSGAEAQIISAHAGAVFLVTRSGRTSETEISESIYRIGHSGAIVQGVLLNDARTQLSAYPLERHHAIV